MQKMRFLVTVILGTVLHCQTMQCAGFVPRTQQPRRAIGSQSLDITHQIQRSFPTFSCHRSYSAKLCAMEGNPSDGIRRKKIKIAKSSPRRTTASPPRGPSKKPVSTKTATAQFQPNLETQLDFARNGHCVLRRAVSKQRIAQLKEELMALAHRRQLVAWQQKVEVAAQSTERAQACRSVAECQCALLELGASPDEVPFLQYFNTWREIPAVLDMARDLASTASVLLDCDSIRLYQDSLFFKRAGDGPTPWHTDGRMAPFDTSLLLTFWIPLHDIPRGGSALVFCSKSHSDFALPFWNEYSKTSDETDSPWNRLDERYGGDDALVDYMPLSMGDITAHSGWLLHCADPPGTQDRIALAISFVDARAPVRRRVDSSGKMSSDDIGDPEDAMSYRDWIRQVPANTPHFRHRLVPILYPPSESKQQRQAKRPNNRSK